MNKKKTLRLMLLGLDVIVVVAVAILAYRNLQQDSTSEPSSPMPFSQETTALAALPPAADMATQWQEDAKLISVAGRWTVRDLRQGRSEERWTFQFFSPSSGRLALFAVVDGEARKIHQGDSPYKVPTFSKKTWRVDSDQALQMWWDQGGRYFVERRPDAELAMQLRIPEASGEIPTWTVVGMVFEQESVFTVQVDALSGATIEP